MGVGDGGGNDGGGMDLIEAVLTCEGNISDPELPGKLACLVHHLRTITRCDSEWLVKRVEPWNSVKVTFSIPREAAIRLHQLAQSGDTALRQLGILSVQVEGDQVVSLKVAGPNNETTEILIRTDGAGPSNESMGHPLRSATQPVSATPIAPQYVQQHSQPHPTPQFRSPGLPTADGSCAASTRAPVIQQISQNQSFAYPLHARQVQQQQQQPTALHQTPTTVLASGVSQSRPTPVVSRQVFHNNPPPPYPNPENVPRQVSSTVSQINGQFNINQSSVSNTLPHSVVHPQQTSIAQPVNGNFRSTGSAVTVSNVIMQPTRGLSRTQGNMVKNSPLLVGLLQQPEQSSTVVSSRSSKGVTVQAPHVSNTAAVNSLNVENGPLPSDTPSTIAGGTFVGRSRDGLTTHQIFSGGSVITNALPNPRYVSPVTMQQHSQGVLQSSLQNSRQNVEGKRVLVASSQSLTNSTHLSSLHPPNSSTSSVITSSNSQILKGEESVPQVTGTLQSASNSKKDSQYLINPNTGLLEPRPTTDSSDSETEGMATLLDDHNSIPLSVNEEALLAAASRKDVQHPDSDISRISLNNIDSRKINQEQIKSKESESSPGSSWENSVISSSPGGEIKLRLKFGKEQVAQTTIVGNTKKPERKDSFITASGAHLQNIAEPRIPKLHIKLHSSQPVIVKPIEDSDSLGKKDPVKEEKGKRKGNRSKPRSETDFDLLRGKNFKLKKERSNSEDISSQVLKIMDGKRNIDENSRFAKLRESKIARLLEENKLSLIKSSGKIETKTRTRLKNTQMRKVGDLSSVGEIASHKILETLPPSITKIAAMHTQQPHRNPSPIPSSFSSGSSLYGSPSIAASLSAGSSSISFTSTTPTTTTAFTSSSEPDKCNCGDPLCKHDSDQCIDALTKIRVNSPPFQGMINGDLTNSEKVGLACRVRTKGSGSLDSASPASKLTIKLKGSEDIHPLDSLKKELPEGLGTVPTFLNSSVQINKVSSEKTPQVSSLTGSRAEEFSEKFKKLESVPQFNKVPQINELSGLKSNSDITIHSVTKNELLSLNKSSETERRLDMTIKHNKSELTKVGRVTCVDVTDRQALEEALKSSRNSSKKSDVSLASNTTLVVDRLRRSNSIYSSNSVPLSSHSQQTISESTNLYSMAVKPDSKEVGCGGSESTTSTLPLLDNSKSDSCIPQQLNLLSSVDNKDCDNRNKTEESDPTATIESNSRLRSPDLSIKNDPPLPPVSPSMSCPSNLATESVSIAANLPSDTANNTNLTEQVTKAGEPPPKIQEIASSNLIKPDVDSPEGTPKGEHGNGQGGEDSGIESMDALSEKSPNHSDQSPNRREDKEAEVFQEKFKKDAKDLQEKQDTSDQATISSSKEEEKIEKGSISCEKTSVDVENLIETFQNTTEDKVNEYFKYEDKETCDVKDEPFLNKSTITTSEPSKSSQSENSSQPDNQKRLSSMEDLKEVSSINQNCKDPCEILSDSSLQLAGTTSESEKSSPEETTNVNLGSVETKIKKLQSNSSESIITSCSSSVAIVTTSVSTSSPVSSTTITQSSPSCNYVSSTLATSDFDCNLSLENSLGISTTTITTASKAATMPISTKPSLLALSLSRPPTSCSLTSQYGASLTNSLDKNTSLPVTSEITLPLVSEKLNNAEPQEDLDSDLSSKSSTLHSNNFTTTACATSMIILTAAGAPSISTTACLGTVNNNNNNKVVTIKQNSIQTASAPINPPVGKTFRLVAINSVNSTSSAVKGQLVTLKPVVGTNALSKNAQISNSSISPKSVEISTARFPANAEVFSPLSSATNIHHETDDLDFVGFSSKPGSALIQTDNESLQKPAVDELSTTKCSEVEPTPLRVNPPLYTYGNRERKKEFENEVEEKEKEESNAAKEIPKGEPEVLAEIKEETFNDLVISTKEKNMDALTIEIPAVDAFPDEKRSTRTTRQSARLASPKVNSPSSDLSPKLEKKSPAGSLTICKPSAVGGVVRSSLSPALRVGKRRRHESESSTASSACEDSQDPPPKVPRRKASDKGSLVNKDNPKTRSSKGKEPEREKVLDSSDEDSLHSEDTAKKATVEEEEGSRPSSRTGRSLTKTSSRQKDRPSSAESSSKESPTTVRRTSRQTKNTLNEKDLQEKDVPLTNSSSNQEVDEEDGEADKESLKVVESSKKPAPSLSNKDVLKTPSGRDASKDRGSPIAPIKGRKDTENELDTNSPASRRKTRSATNTTNEDPSKRRRLSKDK